MLHYLRAGYPQFFDYKEMMMGNASAQKPGHSALGMSYGGSADMW